jgi:hypothetical protein
MKTSAAHRFLIIVSAVSLATMSAAVPASGASTALTQHSTASAGIAPRVAPQPVTAEAGPASVPPRGVHRIPGIQGSARSAAAPLTTKAPAAARPRSCATSMM